ncbi:FAD binding domain-containing protein [Aspergillus heteromorphus CBS 117.55]|uniref:FAD binding domain-containing protein n=1 Tax=Aspergillus heteromorphus CBS 117.55 TaxID=1448321 RepID=A0A317WPA7_9EURO|nr:FAD binding domain-containing protein [Aspergillus heteromorphus CBS 117.55]PWY88286.1 FAD binding domain-containing protein [Aspergillus heteromorphus CBS 117.55]
MAALLVLLSLLLLLQHGVCGLSRERLSRELGLRLSQSASITTWSAEEYPRFSEYGAPRPGAVVTPATEQDVAIIVEYCTSNDISFLAQNGGHWWATTFHLGSDGLLIILRDLNWVTFNSDKTEVTAGGGALVSHVIDAASENNVLVHTANCNCVGILGALLGGGYGNLMGQYGFAVDNVLSFNAVLADGHLRTITSEDKDLFWAFRGAGSNFGIVTSVTLKAHPVSPSDQTGWTGMLSYSHDKVEKVVEAIKTTHWQPQMSIILYYTTTGSPNHAPRVAVSPFYHGTAEEGRSAFSSFFDLDPIHDTMLEVQYPHWNDGTDGSCSKTAYQPAYAAGLATLDVNTWKKVWDEYVSFVSLNGTHETTIMMEAYPLEKARSLPESSSAYAWRNKVNFNAMAIPSYHDTKLDSAAVAWASKVRDMWRATDGLDSPAVYINFAHGDEDLSVVYGQNVDRLKAIKASVDPTNIFNQSFVL